MNALIVASTYTEADQAEDLMALVLLAIVGIFSLCFLLLARAFSRNDRPPRLPDVREEVIKWIVVEHQQAPAELPPRWDWRGRLPAAQQEAAPALPRPSQPIDVPSIPRDPNPYRRALPKGGARRSLPRGDHR